MARIKLDLLNICMELIDIYFITNITGPFTCSLCPAAVSGEGTVQGPNPDYLALLS